MAPVGAEPTARRNRDPRSLLLGIGLLLLTLLVGATWSLAYAPFGSPDDDFHLGSIWCAWGDSPDVCRTVGVEGQQLLVEAPALAGLMEDCWVNRLEESAACSALDDNTVTRADNGLYPPGFYAVMRVFVGEDGVRSILVMRMAAFTFGAALMLAAVLLHPASERARLVLASLVALGPLGLFILASVNPSAASISGLYAGFLACLAMLRAPTARLAWRGAALAAVGFAVAAFSRADASYYAVILTGVAGLASLPIARARVRHLAPPVVALGVVVLALFLTRGLLADPSMISDTGNGRPGRLLAFSRIIALPDLYFGSFAHSTGWLDVAVPPLGHITRTLAFGAIAVFGLARLQWARSLALLMLLGASALLPLWLLAPQDLHVGVYVQPRYLLPLLLAATALLTLRRGGNPTRLLRPQAVTLAVLAAIANSLTMHATIRRFVSGNDVVALDLNAGAQWWWDWSVGPNLLWLSGSVSFLLLAVAVAWLVDRDRTGEPVASPDAPPQQPAAPALAPAPR